MIRHRSLAYIKTVRSKGHVYLYFDTGRKDALGRTEYKRLPDKADPSFGGVYAAMLGHRTRRAATEVLTVTRLVEMYQASAQFEKLAAATKKLYRIYQGRFVEQLPTAPAGEIERADMVALFDKMAATPGAANMMLASVAALYRWGRRGGHVSNRPTEDIDTNDGGEHEPWPEELLTAALASDDDMIRRSVHLLYYTAQRISDVTAMGWSQISAAGVEVVQIKTGKALTIELHPALDRELSGMARGEGTILCDRRGKRLKPDQLRALIQRWAADRGFKIVPHGLRKNAVNALLECGCTVAETASISGQTLQVVEHYAKRRDQTKLARSAISKWGRTDAEQGK